MFACDCLNVIIECEGDVSQKIPVESLNLTENELQDVFFKQEILQVGKLININKSHSGLIETRIVSCWIVHYCINCGVHSHAVHREKGASRVLVSSKLLDTEAIKRLKSSDKFSNLYKVIINLKEMEDDDIFTRSYVPGELENVIKGLKQIAAEALKTEALAVDARIKAFTDEQHNLLNKMREEAFREQQALIRIIINNTVDSSKQLSSTNQDLSNPKAMPSRLNEPLAAGSVKAESSHPINTTKHTPKRQKSCPVGQVSSFDAEALFEFDGIDDIQSADESGVEESDPDEGGKGMAIPKGQHGGGNVIAKSLPMTIPAFMSQARSRGRDDVEDGVLVENNLDIAASIKALARSVHGDTVFGDLPKPRYSTYI